MENQEFANLLQQYQGPVIERWMREMTVRYPDYAIRFGLLDRSRLRKNAEMHFRLLSRLDLPMEKQKEYRLLQKKVEALVGKDEPLEQLLTVVHVWRDAFVLTLLDRGADPPLEQLQRLFNRIDQFQLLMFRMFREKTEMHLRLKERQIDEMHNDRIHLIGRMAASMAHELRNPLTAIEGFLKLIDRQLPPDGSDKLGYYLHIIQSEMEKLKMQITGFLSFSKKGQNEEPPAFLTVNDLVRSVIALFEPRLIDEKISLETSFQAATPIYVQKVALQQVISNLLNNGLEALSSVPECRKIRIVCRETREACIVELTNNGPEIPESIRHRLFTVFVTSKERGTGLGLAICKQIMNRNQGEISFVSNEKETTFKLTFRKEPASGTRSRPLAPSIG